MKRSLLGILLLCVLLVLTGCACKHEETEIVNAADATCVQDGYSGDKVCLKCDETVEKGEAIPALGHTAGEVTGAVEATCTEEGYTGDEPCARSSRRARLSRLWVTRKAK